MRSLPRPPRPFLPVLSVLAFVLAFVLVQAWDLTVPSFGRGTYQAVFLANGQTYFGRFSDRIGPFARLEDVYYLQQSAGATAEAPAQTRLVRRGTELHAPDSRVLLPKSAILFVEDLQDTSPFAQFMRQDARR